MKIPSSIMIKGNKWFVKVKKNLKLDDDSVNGLCDPDVNTIFLDSELKDTERLRVYLHELVHAILHDAHISGHKGGVDGIVEEVICDAISIEFLRLFEIKPRKR